MVLQKRFPRRRRRLSCVGAILLDGGFRHLDTQLPQFSDNARRSPGRIGLPHRANQLPDLLGIGGSAGRAPLAQSPPVVTKSPPLPGDHGARLDELQSTPASLTTGGTATPRTADRMGGCAAWAPITRRPPTDASAPGFPAAVTGVSGNMQQKGEESRNNRGHSWRPHCDRGPGAAKARQLRMRASEENVKDFNGHGFSGTTASGVKV